MFGTCARCEADAIGCDEDGIPLCDDCLFEQECQKAFPPEIDLPDERP